MLSVIYGALLAIGQTDMMRLMSYTSVSHFGFIVLGIFAFTNVGQAGSTLYMVNHGFSTAALFLFAAMLVRRPARQQAHPRLRRVAARHAGASRGSSSSRACRAWPCRACRASSRSSSCSSGSFSTQPVATVIATSGIILAALYILLMYKRVMTGPKPEGLVGEREHDRSTSRGASSGLTAVRDLTTREKLVAAPLIAAFVVLGVLPNIALNVINPAVDKTLCARPASHSEPQPGRHRGRRELEVTAVAPLALAQRFPQRSSSRTSTTSRSCRCSSSSARP